MPSVRTELADSTPRSSLAGPTRGRHRRPEAGRLVEARAAPGRPACSDIEALHGTVEWELGQCEVLVSGGRVQRSSNSASRSSTAGS